MGRVKKYSRTSSLKDRKRHRLLQKKHQAAKSQTDMEIASSGSEESPESKALSVGKVK